MDIFDEARQTISQDRQDAYGNPEDSFELIGHYWTGYLAQKQDVATEEYDLTAEDVAIMMTLFKLARMSGQKYSRDNPRDAIGYLGIYADRLKEKTPEETPEETQEKAPVIKCCSTCGDFDSCIISRTCIPRDHANWRPIEGA